MASQHRQCWICFDESDSEISESYSRGIVEEEDWISPCDCKGGLEWVHESCLLRWIDQTSASSGSNNPNNENNNDNDNIHQNQIDQIDNPNPNPNNVVNNIERNSRTSLFGGSISVDVNNIPLHFRGNSALSTTTSYHCPHCKAAYRVLQDKSLFVRVLDKASLWLNGVLVPGSLVGILLGSMYGALYWHGNSVFGLVNDPGNWSDLTQTYGGPLNGWRYFVFPSIPLTITMIRSPWPDYIFPMISTLSLLTFPLEDQNVIIQLSDLAPIVAFPLAYGLVYQATFDFICRLSYALLIKKSRSKRSHEQQQNSSASVSASASTGVNYNSLDYPEYSNRKSASVLAYLAFPWIAFGTAKLLFSWKSVSQYLISNYPVLAKSPFYRIAMGGCVFILIRDCLNCLYLVKKTLIRHSRRILNRS